MNLKRLTFLFLTLVIITFLSSRTIFAQPGLTQSAQSSQKNEVKKAIVKRILDHARRMLDRANDRLNRMDNIWARVKSRIAKFEASGKDLSGLRDLIKQVDEKRKAAVAAIKSATDAFNAIDRSTNPKQAILEFVTRKREVKKALRAYHKAIVNVIRNVKGRSDSDEERQTPTPPDGTPQPTPTEGAEPTFTPPPIGEPSGTPPFYASPTSTHPPDNTPTPIGGIDYTIPVGSKDILTINIGPGSGPTLTLPPPTITRPPSTPTTTPAGPLDYTIPVGTKGSITITIQ